MVRPAVVWGGRGGRVGAVVTMGYPSINGDRAELKVFWYYEPVPKRLGAEYYTLELIREGAAWRVSRVLSHVTT